MMEMAQLEDDGPVGEAGQAGGEQKMGANILVPANWTIREGFHYIHLRKGVGVCFKVKTSSESTWEAWQ